MATTEEEITSLENEIKLYNGTMADTTEEMGLNSWMSSLPVETILITCTHSWRERSSKEQAS
jgi:hypothetical protein